MANKYVEDGELANLNMNANKLAKILLDANAMSKKGQLERHNQQMLIDILIAIHRQHAVRIIPVLLCLPHF